VLRVRSPPLSGARAGYGDAKRKRGLKMHLAAYTPGHPLALHVTPASTDYRVEVGQLAQAVRASIGQGIGLAYVEGGCTGPRAADAAGAHGIELEVARLPDVRRGFLLLPRRRVVERPFARAARFRRLVKAYEGYASTLADLHLSCSSRPRNRPRCLTASSAPAHSPDSLGLRAVRVWLHGSNSMRDRECVQPATLGGHRSRPKPTG
jgi:transposase